MGVVIKKIKAELNAYHTSSKLTCGHCVDIPYLSKQVQTQKSTAR
jgi:hypothetical protein